MDTETIRRLMCEFNSVSIKLRATQTFAGGCVKSKENHTIDRNGESEFPILYCGHFAPGGAFTGKIDENCKYRHNCTGYNFKHSVPVPSARRGFAYST